MAPEKITVAATISATADVVWRAYTTPADIMNWNFASDDWRCPAVEQDLRVGGAYKARMEAKDGSFGFDLEGVYEAVDPGKAITLVMSDGRRTRTTFAAANDGTAVATTFDAETENPIEMQRDGWQAILNNFKSYVEKIAAASG